MERKKIAILLPWLKMGGTNKVAIRLARELLQYCDVTIILSQKTGELQDEVPENVRIIIDEMRSFRELVKYDICHLKLRLLWEDVAYYWRVRTGKDGIDNYKYIVSRQKEICPEQFDCAISYHGQSPERLLNLLYRIHSRKKVAWIHGEFGGQNNQSASMAKYYAQLDGLFFVSEPTKDSFQKQTGVVLPESIVYYNPLDKAEILEKAAENPEVQFDSQYCNILTVGRVSAEKGQDMVPEIVWSLKKAGHAVRWYLIGDGDMLPSVQQKAREYGVEKEVICLGTKQNPYCYMKACDIYVQPSYTEGYSTTICEAAILGKAIIGTIPSGGIRRQISDGVDGLIVEATVPALTAAIEACILKPEIKQLYEKHIQQKDFEGKGEIQKFLRFLNS